ncbi:MAG TPA: hypothetical protein VGQ93_03410 [Lysobacter sp.]|jgi:hypothetical protein|nr:hypothetical protein [Lysobacter sp.]
MTQRNNHSPIAIAQPQGSAVVLRAGVLQISAITLATLALITVLVLITGSISAEYGFV